jgi:hypothetical protein
VDEHVAQLRRERRDEGPRGDRVVDAEDLAEHALEFAAMGDDRRTHRSGVLVESGRNGGCIEEQMETTLAQQEDAIADHQPSLRDGLVVRVFYRRHPSEP